MITPGWPTARSTTTNEPAPRSSSGNGSCYRSTTWTSALTAAGITPRFIQPRRPQTNGKVERFNRTLLDEWAYARAYNSEAHRRQHLDKWLHLYNHHRSHTALGAQPPFTRVNNLAGHST